MIFVLSKGKRLGPWDIDLHTLGLAWLLSIQLGCRAHIFSTHGSQGMEGGGLQPITRITESSMCRHQLFYISRCL